VRVAPPPLPEPTHWSTLTGVSGSAPGVPALMLLVTVTLHVIGCAASLSDALHWSMVVTRLVELYEKVPSPGGQAARAQVRVTVTVDPEAAPSRVLTTETEQLISVVAPAALAPMPLHWSIATVEARAAGVPPVRTQTSSRRGTASRCRARVREVRKAAMGSRSFLEKRDKPQLGNRARARGARAFAPSSTPERSS
jgi:hypothetical protein